MRKIFFKKEVCSGCGLCEIYCQLQYATARTIGQMRNENPIRPIRHHRHRRQPAALRRVPGEPAPSIYCACF